GERDGEGPADEVGEGGALAGAGVEAVEVGERGGGVELERAVDRGVARAAPGGQREPAEGRDGAGGPPQLDVAHATNLRRTCPRRRRAREHELRGRGAPLRAGSEVAPRRGAPRATWYPRTMAGSSLTFPREYNAAADLIGRNLQAGRGDKIAYY